MSVIQGIAAALTPLGLIWTAVLLSVATFLHELAHYALARAQGVPVKSFSVGMGPVLLRRSWRGTEWRLSLLPIGGYVEIDGMAPEEGPGGQLRSPTRGFAALPALGKIAVLLAGPLMNLILALGLMTALFSTQGMPAPDRARIESVNAGSRAEALGLKAGDVITAINGQDIPDIVSTDGQTRAGWETLRTTLARPGPHVFTVRSTQGGAVRTREVRFDWQPTVNGQRQLLGIRYGPDIQPVSVPAAFAASVTTTVEVVPQVLRAFGSLFARFVTLDISRDENVSGPIGTAEIVSRAAELSPWALVQVAIMLNLSLAFFNLIPIPGLDGGRILLVLLGALKGRPLTFAQEQAINIAGFAFVMMLMLFVVVRDVSRFF
ncbi:M50 family metallopeptidase [Deinococcus deserti]|uniref:Putative membrane-associated zinc metalloproteases putative membrane protein n=1 Tax=Deinococcus deserti (strain DSM 17065 / CIP 109153 / LMG 22923 / VCD115) TaxID=546414 RepID=C1CVP4_DEIDV|nr:M50 family metallopeptidase [Deinococcus deserti]ACO46261.1 putative membrane-associated zinc metalloproteases; putative membrane protein [Deinococcus deserti VCD115]